MAYEKKPSAPGGAGVEAAQDQERDARGEELTRRQAGPGAGGAGLAQGEHERDLDEQEGSDGDQVRRPRYRTRPGPPLPWLRRCQ